MNVFGLMVAQNEADIIGETLAALQDMRVFDAIFFYDLGSDDDTLAIAKGFGNLLYEPQVLDRPYTEGLRFELLADRRSFYADGDWLALVDADEIYAEDPRGYLALAESEGATTVRTYQCEFMLTSEDLGHEEDTSLPHALRRQHYLIQWSEDRFFKFSPDASALTAGRPCSRRFLNRHYQYRSPAQIQTRIDTRLRNRRLARQLPARQSWPQVFSHDWRDYIIPRRLLHRMDGGGHYRFGLPQGIQWKDYYSSNPFSTIFPQIATKLAAERRVLTAGESPPPANDAVSVWRDDYRAKVVTELVGNVKAGRGSESLRTGVTLARHLYTWFRRTLVPVWRCAAVETLRRVRVGAVNGRRFISRRARGSLRADPNPIIVPQLVWQGATTISWESTATRTELRVGSPDGAQLASGGSSGQVAIEGGISDGTIIYLRDATTDGEAAGERALASVTVFLRHGHYL
jgi:hypothetical protein